MTITWYGQSCFKILTRPSFASQNFRGATPSPAEVIIYIDPFSKEIGLRPPSGRGDIVLVTHQHFDHNNIKAIKGEPFVITGPGEYEIKGIYIQGIKSFHDAKKGKERGENTIYLIQSEKIEICDFGDFGEDQLSAQILDRLNGVGVLMIPVGGAFTIDGERAADIVNQVEPGIVIPMHYKIPGISVNLAPADKFLKVMGIERADLQEKISLREKDLQGEETKVIVMKPA